MKTLFNASLSHVKSIERSSVPDRHDDPLSRSLPLFFFSITPHNEAWAWKRCQAAARPCLLHDFVLSTDPPFNLAVWNSTSFRPLKSVQPAFDAKCAKHDPRWKLRLYTVHTTSSSLFISLTSTSISSTRVEMIIPKTQSIYDKAVAYGRTHFNFFRIHLTVFTLLPFLFSAIFHAANGSSVGNARDNAVGIQKVQYIDSLFLCFSAMTWVPYWR